MIPGPRGNRRSVSGVTPVTISSSRCRRSNPLFEEAPDDRFVLFLRHTRLLSLSNVQDHPRPKAAGESVSLRCMKLECMTRMRVEPKHPIEAVDVLGDFRFLGQFAWATSRDIVGDHQPERITSRAGGAGSPLLFAIARWTSDGSTCATQPPAPACQSLSSPSTLPWTRTWTISGGRRLLRLWPPPGAGPCDTFRRGQVHIPSSPCCRTVMLSGRRSRVR